MGSIFWGVARVVGIVWGTVTLLKLALAEGLIDYPDLFRKFLDEIREGVGLGWLMDKVIGPWLHWAIDAVRNLGFPLPPLQDAWQPTLILSSLIVAAISRHQTRFLVIAGPIAAFGGAVFAGLTGNPGLGFSATIGIILLTVYSANRAAYFAADQEGRLGNDPASDDELNKSIENWTNNLFKAEEFNRVLNAAIPVFIALFMLIIMITIFNQNFPTWILSVVLAFIGLSYVYAGYVEATEYPPARVGGRLVTLWKNQYFSTGIDILGTMGLSIAIALSVKV